MTLLSFTREAGALCNSNILSSMYSCFFPAKANTYSLNRFYQQP